MQSTATQLMAGIPQQILPQHEAKLLIVDDEKTMRRLLGRILEEHGYNCTLAADAAEARECLSEERFDLVLCDLNMPGESGLHLIQYALSKYPETATP